MQEFIENQEVYTSLFKGYAIMPEEDIRKNIEQLGTKYKNISWASFAAHLKRMKSTLEESTLSQKRQSWVSESLNPQIREYTYYQNIPERRPYITEGDRGELEYRRRILANNGFFNNEEDLWREKEAEGEVVDWRDIRTEIIVAIDAKLRMLDERLLRLADPVVLPTQPPVIHNVQDKEDTSIALNNLFRLNFTVRHCDGLMKKLLVGPGFKPPTHLSAKIWALLFVLEQNSLLSHSAAEIAAIAGRHYGYQMAEKPSKVRESKPYKEAFKKLSVQVRDDMANKLYGPNHA